MNKTTYKETISNPLTYKSVTQLNELFANMTPGTYTPQIEFGDIDFSVDALK